MFWVTILKTTVNSLLRANDISWRWSCANGSRWRSEQQPIFSLKGPVMESAKALTMVFKVNYNCTPVIYYQRYIGLLMGPSMVNARVLLMGSYRSTYGSAKRFTVIFNSYTPWLGGIIFSGPLWSPYLSLFLSYIWSTEKCFILKYP